MVCLKDDFFITKLPARVCVSMGVPIFFGLDVLFLYVCVLAPERWERICHPATTTKTVLDVPQDTDPESSLRFSCAHETHSPLLDSLGAYEKTLHSVATNTPSKSLFNHNLTMKWQRNYIQGPHQFIQQLVLA